MNNQHSDDISIRQYLQAVWSDWRLLAWITGAFAVISVAFALLVTEKYEGTVVVVDAEQNRASGLYGTTLGQLGGLAGLAGIDLSGLSGGSTNARAVLNSRMLVEEFIARNNLLPHLFKDDWDAATGNWISDQDDTPTLWLGADTFVEDILTIEEDAVTGVVVVTVEWDDPKAAAAWANGLVALANQIVRNRDLRDAEKSVAYLKGEIGKTNLVGLQQVLFSLIESEMQTITLARVRDEYAFSVIDPAVVPELRSFPHRSLLVIAGTALGGFIALMVILVRLVLRREEEFASKSS